MEKRNHKRCSVVSHSIDGGVLIRITGTCSHESAAATRSMVLGYTLGDPNFIMFLIGDLAFERISDLIDICCDFIALRKPLYLITPDPEIRKEVEKLSCDTGCFVSNTLEEALCLIR